MHKWIPTLLGLSILVLAIWLITTSSPGIQQFIERLNHIAYDIQQRTRILTVSPKVKNPIIIVDVDNKSLKEYGRWPWRRSDLAQLIQALQERGAVIIALDMTFPEVEPNIAQIITTRIEKESPSPSTKHLLNKLLPEYDSDTQFSNALKNVESVLGMTFVFGELINAGALPPPTLSLTPQTQKLGFIDASGILSNIPLIHNAAKGVGFINAFPDEDGVVRQAPLLVRYQNNLYPSLAFEAARLYLLVNNISLVTATYHNTEELEGIQFGNALIHTDASGRVIIPYLGHHGKFLYFSAVDVIRHRVAKDAFQGALVFIGTSAIGLGDLQTTPVGAGFPGVEIQATIAEAILSNSFPYQPAWAIGAELDITLFIGFLCAFLFPRLGPFSLILLTLLIPTLLIYANNQLWITSGLVLSFLIPILVVIGIGILNMIYGYFFEMRRREQLRQIFDQYVPPEHIEDMVKAHGNYGLLGEERDMSVLFSDIRNFTTLAEKMNPIEVKNMLDQFFTTMTEIIFKYKGTIDKYVGDMIMAFWGAPLKNTQHAQNAIEAALDMQAKLTELNLTLTASGLPMLHIGIGINSGNMIVGDMGSRFRRNYTVLGDTVNLGSRLESLCRYYGVKIIVGDATQKDQARFVFRQLDRVMVKGKQFIVQIYEVICRVEELTDTLREEVSQSEEALSHYYQQAWDRARTLFQTLHNRYPEKLMYSIFLDRITTFQSNPPPPDWNGAYQHLGK